MMSEDQDESRWWVEEETPLSESSEESKENAPGRRMVRDALNMAIVALAIHLGMNLLGFLSVREGAYRLHSRGLASLVEFLGLLLFFEWSMIIVRVALAGINTQKGLSKLSRWGQKSLMLMMLIAMPIGLWHVKLARFHAVYMDNDYVTLEGNSWLAHHRVRLETIDEVVLVHTPLYDELLFRWFDQVYASCFILRFDAEALRSVEALRTALKQRGIETKDEIE